MILLIDNYDSFTYNLYQYMGIFREDIEVVRNDKITIEEICHEFYLSRSSLQALFKTHLNSSPKNHLLNIKLQKSKELIRENQYTISEIAYMLGFSSIHYFSRLFKKNFNTTPSAYVKKIAENQNVSKNDMPARE